MKMREEKRGKYRGKWWWLKKLLVDIHKGEKEKERENL